jgi:hypothetical protein
MADEKAKGGHGIRRVEIEPDDSGSKFVTKVHLKETPSKDGKSPGVYPEPATHIHSSTNELADFFHRTFPSTGGKSRSKKGKSVTSVKGGSRVDTYEGGQGDNVGE